MVSVEKSITKISLASVLVEDLLSSGGTIRENTSSYTALNTLDTTYWKYHTPYGVPGDELIILENYRIEKVCQTLKSFFITVKYQNGTEKIFTLDKSYPLTPEGIFVSSENMPEWASRLKLKIQDVQMSQDNSEWIFTVVPVVGETE